MRKIILIATMLVFVGCSGTNNTYYFATDWMRAMHIQGDLRCVGKKCSILLPNGCIMELRCDRKGYCWINANNSYCPQQQAPFTSHTTDPFSKF